VLKVLAVVSVAVLTGCATPPQWLANHYDSNDSCQVKNHGGDWNKIPSYCGASGGRVYIYNNHNVQQGYIK